MSPKRSGVPRARAGEGAGRIGAEDRDQVGQTIATVERAADLLLHLSEADQITFGVTEIADALGLSKAAVHRILASLRTRGLIELDELTRRYSLGVGAMKLGLAYLDRIDLRRVAHPELVTLCERTVETATLSVRSGWTRFYVDQVTPPREVIMSVRLGAPHPLHAGGSSKAFLAFLADPEIDAYLSQPELARLTPETITDRRKLRREIEQIRERGYAQSYAERQGGAASVAAPVLDHLARPQGVVSVCGPIERFRGEAEACAEALLEVTRRLSARLGHEPAPT
jgi:IclR family transcriptional regulator, acetate operon repressor